MSTTRRTFLTTAAAGVAALGLGAATAAADVGIQTAQQREWRYCDKCHGMFYDGVPVKGVCPAGGGHRAQGWNFHLPYDMPGDDSNQIDWRFCEKCYGMFYDGVPTNKGYYPTGGSHRAQGFNFTLPHDYMRVPVNSQWDWAYCLDCWGLFYNGYPDKGACPVPGPHVKPSSGSFDFMLPHLP